MKLRTRIFNWFSGGRITLKDNTVEQAKERLQMAVSTPMAIAGGGINLGQFSQSSNDMFNQPGSMTIRLTQATGGTIVSIGRVDGSYPSLYVIPAGDNFDSELGKIITLHTLKQD